MPSNSAGAYELPSSYFVQNGDTILPVQHNPPLEDLAAGMTARVMRDGRSVMTGALQMGDNKITGMADGVALTDAATLGQVQNYQGLAGLSYTVEETEAAPPSAGCIRVDDFADLSNVTKVWVSATTNADIDFSDTILDLAPGSKTVKNRIMLTVNGMDCSWLVDGATDYTGEATPYVELDVSGHDGATELDAATAQLNIEWSGADGEQGDPGDMEASTYDPNSVASDAFDMDNMVEGTDTKILTSAERVLIDDATLPTGGTTGQVLAKASGTDFDTAWATGGGTGDVEAASTLGDDELVLGDGGAKGVKTDGTSIADVALNSENLSGMTAATAFGNIKQAATTSATGVVEEATVAEVRSAANGKFLDAALIESASAEVTLTDAATIALDWDSFINGVVTLTDDRTLGNPTNEQPGTYRTVRVIGNNSTDRTLTFGSEFEGNLPSLTDIDSTQQYILSIFCVAAGHFIISSQNATVS